MAFQLKENTYVQCKLQKNLLLLVSQPNVSKHCKEYRSDHKRAILKTHHMPNNFRTLTLQLSRTKKVQWHKM